MAHTIIVGVWIVPTHAYIISTAYLHQGGYCCQWYSEGTNQHNIWVIKTRGDQTRWKWKHIKATIEMSLVVSEPHLSQILQIGWFCVLVF